MKTMSSGFVVLPEHHCHLFTPSTFTFSLDSPQSLLSFIISFLKAASSPDSLIVFAYFSLISFFSKIGSSPCFSFPFMASLFKIQFHFYLFSVFEQIEPLALQTLPTPSPHFACPHSVIFDCCLLYRFLSSNSYVLQTGK